MNPSERLLDYIESIETLVSPARHLAVDANKPSVVTGGYGETDPGRVHLGMIVSPQLARAWVNADLTAIWASVQHIVTYAPISQGMCDALTDFCYNEGLHALQTSTLLRKLNAKDLRGAAAQFMLWDIAGGEVLPGLYKRRAIEQSWFLTQ